MINVKYLYKQQGIPIQNIAKKKKGKNCMPTSQEKAFKLIIYNDSSKLQLFVVIIFKTYVFNLIKMSLFPPDILIDCR